MSKFCNYANCKYFYLSLVIDGHSNKVLGYSIGMNNDEIYPCPALIPNFLDMGPWK